MGLRCLGSLVRCIESVELVLHDDGSLTSKDIEALSNALPIARLVPRSHADEIMREQLGRFPSCFAAREENVLMLKLFDVALLEPGDIYYCDTDVLFFRTVTGLFDGHMDAIFMRDSGHAYAVRPWHLMGRDRLHLPRQLNSGLFRFRRGMFDLEFLEWLLSKPAMRAIFTRIPVWAEQTCWAALAHRAGCRLWDEEQIAVVNRSWSLGSRAVAAHFVSSSRARLAEIDESVLSLHSTDAPATVSVTNSVECSAFDLAASQISRRVRRACGY